MMMDDDTAPVGDGHFSSSNDTGGYLIPPDMDTFTAVEIEVFTIAEVAPLTRRERIRGAWWRFRLNFAEPFFRIGAALQGWDPRSYTDD